MSSLRSFQFLTFENKKGRSHEGKRLVFTTERGGAQCFTAVLLECLLLCVPSRVGRQLILIIRVQVLHPQLPRADAHQESSHRQVAVVVYPRSTVSGHQEYLGRFHSIGRRVLNTTAWLLRCLCVMVLDRLNTPV